MNKNYFFERNIYTVGAKSVMQISFANNPNYFRLLNMGAGDLYFSASGIPTTERFDMKIVPSGSRMHVEPHGKQMAHVYNDSMQSVTFALLTFADEFSPLVLALASDESIAEVVGGSGGGSFDGIIRGFNVALPSGANTIGNVNVNANSQLDSIIAEMKKATPSGTNTIGKVDVNTNEQLTAILAKLAGVGITYGKFSSGTVATSGTTITAGENRKLCKISFLSNDSETALSVVMDGTTMNINAGEVLDNFEIWADSIQLVGGGAYRMAYNEMGV